MKKSAFLLARVAGLFIAAVFLAGCYAQLADQKGYLNLGLQFADRQAPAGTSEIIVLVANSGYEDTLKEMLYLIDKGKKVGLSGSETDQLTTDAKQLATSGLVKFGGFPFYQTTIGSNPGSFQIPGVPAGRDYFVKIFVFSPGVSFTVEDIDANFGGLVHLENLVFNPEVYTTPWQNWTLNLGQPVEVNAGQSVAVNVTLVTPP
ncbi:MAG: hypothetical protein ABSG85_12595 [Spirochaetia bacterium]